MMMFCTKIKMYLMLIYGIVKFILGGRKARYLLVDTPIHNNLGDLAIAIAEKQFVISKINSNDIFEITSFEFDKLGKFYSRLYRKDGVVLVHGGGFIGNLWPTEEFRFRQIIKMFYSNKIIVLPQTVTFDLSTEEGRKFFNESYAIYVNKLDLYIFAREKKSYDFMTSNMPDVNCILVPDIVTSMHHDVGKYVRKDILLCLRRDHEKAIHIEDVEKIKHLINTNYNDVNYVVTDTVIDNISTIILPSYREKLVEKKLIEFAKSRLVITDRLHGMVFAALTNTPCIALANSNGKVEGVYEWVKSNDYIFFAHNVQEVEEILMKLDLDKEYKYDYSAIINKYVELEKLL